MSLKAGESNRSDHISTSLLLVTSTLQFIFSVLQPFLVSTFYGAHVCHDKTYLLIMIKTCCLVLKRKDKWQNSDKSHPGLLLRVIFMNLE